MTINDAAVAVVSYRAIIAYATLACNIQFMIVAICAC